MEDSSRDGDEPEKVGATSGEFARDGGEGDLQNGGLVKGYEVLMSRVAATESVGTTTTATTTPR